MYLAELKGKLSSKNENKEDILTSNVFSFFKYSDRKLFLKEYLHCIGLEVTKEDAEKAEFIFWPKLYKRTEPDVIIMVGEYYLLLEAKLFSDFSSGTKKVKAQLLREIECGLIESNSNNMKFKIIAITADYYYKEKKFRIIPTENKSDFIWTNWQFISNFLFNIINRFKANNFPNKLFALDLYNLLIKKKLSYYKGLSALPEIHLKRSYKTIFYNNVNSKYRDYFIGFLKSFSKINKLDINIIRHLKTEGIFYRRMIC